MYIIVRAVLLIATWSAVRMLLMLLVQIWDRYSYIFGHWTLDKT